MLTDMDSSIISLAHNKDYLILITGALTAGLVAAAVVYQLFCQIFSKHNGTSSLQTSCSWPPSPPALPILGHLHLVGANVHHDMHALSLKYGPLYHLEMGSTHSLVVSSAEMAKLVLKTHDKSFASRPSTGAVLEIFSHNRQDVGCAPYGPHWRRMRKLCMLELFSSKRIQSFEYLRNEEMASLVRNILDESASGHPITEDEAELNNFRDTITEMFILSGVVNNLGDYFPSIRWMDMQGYERRMKKCAKNFDDFIFKIIEQKRALDPTFSGNGKDEDKKDLMDVLLTLPSERDGPLSDHIVVATMQDILAAGVDTSSSTVEWALAEMIRRPSVMKKVQDEIDALVGKSRKVEESDLSELPFLAAVVKETFRLHPAAPLLLPHESIEPCKLLGYEIPAKTRLYVNVWAIGRDPSEWVNPSEFTPERFVGSEVDVSGQHFGLLPFGSGRRMCPGMALGLTVIQFTLARLLHSFDFSLPSPEKAEDLDMSETFGLTITKTQPLRLTAFPRLPRELLE